MITIHRLLWGLADKLTRTRPQRASRSIKLNVRACLFTTNVCARFPSGRSFDPDPCDKQATARAQKINPLIDSKLPALQIRSPEPPLSLRLNRHCQLAGCRTTLLIDSTSGAGVGGCHSAAPLLLLLQLTHSVALELAVATQRQGRLDDTPVDRYIGRSKYKYNSQSGMCPLKTMTAARHQAEPHH